jgi:uncharacterized protein (TIGR02001 family)
MSRLRVLKSFGFTVLAATGLLVAASAPASAQVSVSAGSDFTSNYIFRGIPQTKNFVSSQPWVEVGFDATDSASVAIGTWNSLFDAPDGAPGPFYESDFYASLSTAAGPVGVDVGYTVYMSPDDWFATTHEISLGFGFDSPAAPYATLAFEVDGGADLGSNKGTYLELGMEPAYGPLSFPVALGLSLNNYYETAPDEDHTYGFFSVGMTTAVSVTDNVEVWGGLSLINMGELGGETTQGAVVFGLSVSN